MKYTFLTVLTILSSVAFAQVDYLIRVRDPVFKSTITVEEKNIPQVKIKPGETIPYHLIKGQNILFVALTIDAPLDTTKSWIFNLNAVEDTGVVTPPPLPSVLGSIDNIDPRTKYNGIWQQFNNAVFHNGTSSYSTVTNATIEIKFIGKQIEWWTEKARNHGIAGLSIDGGTEVNVDIYANTTVNNTQKVWTSPVLSAGEHTLVIRVTGTRNAGATENTLIHDRIVVIQ